MPVRNVFAHFPKGNLQTLAELAKVQGGLATILPPCCNPMTSPSACLRSAVLRSAEIGLMPAEQYQRYYQGFWAVHASAAPCDPQAVDQPEEQHVNMHFD